MTKNLDSSITVDFLDKLKNQTASAHKKLESLPVSASILSPNMKISDYCHYLSLMYDVHKSTQEIVFPLLKNHISDLEERAKTPLITDDLSFLNYTKKESVSIFKNQDINVPFALGILYVIEGSTLGGRFILKNIETIPGLDQQNGVSYFTGYGNKTGSYWKTFLNELTAYENENQCEDDIIKGAVYTFDCIYNHFLTQENNEN
ncbi:biliverdin-producing heme oxygenase [Flavobacterium bizetiae]|uniref:biliverdin-producing heme oxygenase n=1 Tax=Flavobacterium bizetiae TaxID=2704140 RepID=UPI0021E7914A|nr:biliverdin-producing heme oxygenase [Flavobacterium bizetiae]UTN03307.1 biliverdin-producing heme oxygenase [Flavobacterium bizetiae]